MRILVLCFLVLCVVSFTFSVPAQERDASETRVESSESLVNGDIQEQEDDTKITASVDDEITELDESEVSPQAERAERRRKFNKRVKNRYNKLNNKKDRRKKWRRRRPSNGKKGPSKSRPKAAVEIIPYDLDIQETNQEFDSLLLLVSQYMREGTGFTMKLATPPTNIKAKPWGYVVLEMAENGTVTPPELVRSKRESDDNENDGDDVELDADETEGDEDNYDEKEEITTPLPEDNKNAEVSEHEEQTEPNKETSELENDEDDDEDDDHLETKVEKNNSTSEESKQQAAVKLSPIPQPIKLDDGSIIYHLQLLDDEDIVGNPEAAEESSSFKSRALDDIRDARKGDKSRSRSQRRFKRPKATVNGLETIKRSEDVTAGIQNGTDIRVYEILLDVGPVYLTFVESAVLSVPVSRVSTRVLKARLRLKERDGKLMAVRMKPLKMQPNNVVVSLKVAAEQSMFDDQTARLVTHVSQEMARAWNSGFLLRHIKRSFKQLLISGSNIDEKAEEKRSIRNQAEVALQKIFSSVNSTTSSTTSSPEVTAASDEASTTPVPLIS